MAKSGVKAIELRFEPRRGNIRPQKSAAVFFEYRSASSHRFPSPFQSRQCKLRFVDEMAVSGNGHVVASQELLVILASRVGLAPSVTDASTFQVGDTRHRQMGPEVSGRKGLAIRPGQETSRTEAMLVDVRKLVDRIGVRAGWKATELGTRVFRHTLDGGQAADARPRGTGEPLHREPGARPWIRGDGSPRVRSPG
jgi:hypothetical protein